jgi:hypothetical protein
MTDALAVIGAVVVLVLALLGAAAIAGGLLKALDKE